MTRRRLQPSVTARLADLRYVADSQTPGIKRIPRGRGFIYRGPANHRVSRQDLARIKSLVIPPAWTDVWICPWPHGHLQATGRDAAGRKQYRYHPRWRAIRDGHKFDRLYEFGRALASIRRHVRRDLRRPGLPRQKVVASVVRLLEETLARVGNVEYVRANDSFGLTTLRDRHVRVRGDTIKLRFRGKGGVAHAFHINDRRLARLVRRCQGLPGRELFQYRDDRGDVNEYLRAVTGDDFTAKDYRTWAGTVLAAREFANVKDSSSTSHRERLVPKVMARVAQELGNTPAVCRKCYVHPAIIQAFVEGTLLTTRPRPNSAHGTRQGLRVAERKVLGILRRVSRAPSGPRRKAA
jgi:DNA topoisomerase-1